MKPDLRGSEDFLAGLLFLAIGAGAMVVAREYPFGTAMRMGSGELGRVTWGWGPLACIAASMVVFGFLLPRLGLALTAVMTAFARRVKDGWGEDEDEDRDRAGPRANSAIDPAVETACGRSNCRNAFPVKSTRVQLAGRRDERNGRR